MRPVIGILADVDSELTIKLKCHYADAVENVGDFR